MSESLNRVPGLTILNRQNYAQDTQLSIRGYGARATFGVRGIRLLLRETDLFGRVLQSTRIGVADEIAAAVKDSNLVVSAVLSGNRNFEGRINPVVRANYLASPPLVVAFAIAGTVDIDMRYEPLGTGSDGQPVYLADIWPTQEEVQSTMANSVTAELFRERGAQVQLQMPDSLPTLRADPDRLLQVLLNLLSNAAKFVPTEGGRVQVRLSSQAQGVRVEVHDNGPGVPPDQAQLVFEKFRQGGDPAHRPQGTGLGLPISRQIVEHFGGRLWLKSEPGQGACFGFDLPWQRQQDKQPS